MGFAAVVPRAPLIGRFLVPFEDGQLRIAAMDYNPPHRVLAFFAADFTSITRLYHSDPQRQLSVVSGLYSLSQLAAVLGLRSEN